MKATDNFDWKRLVLILAPAILILSSAGTLAWPSLAEMRELKEEEVRALATIAEGNAVVPYLAAVRKSRIDAAQVVQTWLEESVPHTSSPRIFLLDLKLAEQDSGISIRSCRMRSEEPLPRDLEPDGSPKGSLWDIKLYGTFEQAIRFSHLLQHGERLYTLRRVEVKPTKKGRIKMDLRVFVHGLTPKLTQEGSGQ